MKRRIEDSKSKARIVLEGLQRRSVASLCAVIRSIHPIPCASLPTHQFEHGFHFFNFHTQGGALAFNIRQHVQSRFPLWHLHALRELVAVAIILTTGTKRIKALAQSICERDKFPARFIGGRAVFRFFEFSTLTRRDCAG